MEKDYYDKQMKKRYKLFEKSTQLSLIIGIITGLILIGILLKQTIFFVPYIIFLILSTLSILALLFNYGAHKYKRK